MRRLRRFLSTDFGQPLGTRIDVEHPRGYYVDLSVKARVPAWPPPFAEGDVGGLLTMVIAQYGLGAWERWLAEADEAWLAVARGAADHLVAAQEPDGAWRHPWPLPHTFAVRPPWASGMGQGQGASLLVRLYGETGDERYAEAARRAAAPLRGPVAAAPFEGALLPEEYPTDPASHVLNGAIFGLWGLHDVAAALGEDDEPFRAGAQALAAGIGRWDTGWWSRYDLYPHRVVNVASLAYHRLHITQLAVMEMLAPDPRLTAARERFEGYLSGRAARARVMGAKAAFRALTPRWRTAG